MEHEAINWIWVMMILPVLAGVFKSEIGKIFTALGVYLRREFKPRDKVLLLSEGPGTWGKVEIKQYRFHLSSTKRGVYVIHEDGGIERISLLAWATIRKRPTLA